MNNLDAVRMRLMASSFWKVGIAEQRRDVTIETLGRRSMHDDMRVTVSIHFVPRIASIPLELSQC